MAAVSTPAASSRAGTLPCLFAFAFHLVKVDRRHLSRIQMRREGTARQLGSDALRVDAMARVQLNGSVSPQGAFGNGDGGADEDGGAAGTTTTASSSHPQYV